MRCFRARPKHRHETIGAICAVFDYHFASSWLLQKDSSGCGEYLGDANEIVGGRGDDEKPFDQQPSAVLGGSYAHRSPNGGWFVLRDMRRTPRSATKSVVSWFLSARIEGRDSHEFCVLRCPPCGRAWSLAGTLAEQPSVRSVVEECVLFRRFSPWKSRSALRPLRPWPRSTGGPPPSFGTKLFIFA